LDQSLQFLALGQTGVLGQLATTYQLANGLVGGTELQEFLALVLFNQVCSNGHWFVLLVLDLAAEGDVHHGWLQLGGSLGLANPHSKNIGPMHAHRNMWQKMWPKHGFCGLSHVMEIVAKISIFALTSFCMFIQKEKSFLIICKTKIFLGKQLFKS
jgi:hypothetical protein